MIASTIAAIVDSYPWIDLIKSVISISAAILVFRIKKEDEDAITTAAGFLMQGTEILLNSVYFGFRFLEYLIRRYLWFPLIVLILTWSLFPEIVDDLFFLMYIGFRRYKSLFF
ncbi:hypothetical protein PoB_005622800 [Plakobranchus ocellatus]|uniref:Uncharacterized protein n=1 Tax=Plakobranchus ocellatus TaxID=259542 RepID=A0AAV4CCW4_9GAST|nr:hypothetical protein PoB_005622800 [Plakobranchus ocellatus]